jgi:hypothetical protein
VLSLQSLPSQAMPSTPELRVNAHGFSLHAAVRWRADQRKELEQLCRYITRPAIANERLKRNRAGQVVLQLKSPYKDGTTHIVMEPLEFMERLAARAQFGARSRIDAYRLNHPRHPLSGEKKTCS